MEHDGLDYLSLYQAATKVTESVGIELSDGAGQFILTHARQTPAKIAAGMMPDGEDPVANFRRFGEELVKVSGRQGLRQLGSGAIQQVLDRICPLFPFCGPR
jgi:hypothetical protein